MKMSITMRIRSRMEIRVRLFFLISVYVLGIYTLGFAFASELSFSKHFAFDTRITEISKNTDDHFDSFFESNIQFISQNNLLSYSITNNHRESRACFANICQHPSVATTSIDQTLRMMLHHPLV